MCARLVKKIWCDYIIDCSCYSEENKNRHNFLCATAWITIVAKSDVWIAITFSLLMQMPRFTYHFNSFNLLFKAVPNLVQNIAFEKNIPVPTQGCPLKTMWIIFYKNHGRRTGLDLVSYPDPSTSQLRMDYITATLELELVLA